MRRKLLYLSKGSIVKQIMCMELYTTRSRGVARASSQGVLITYELFRRNQNTGHLKYGSNERCLSSVVYQIKLDVVFLAKLLNLNETRKNYSTRLARAAQQTWYSLHFLYVFSASTVIKKRMFIIKNWS